MYSILYKNTNAANLKELLSKENLQCKLIDQVDFSSTEENNKEYKKLIESIKI